MNLQSKLRKTLTLSALLLALTACAASTKSGSSAKPELSVTQKCARPVLLPDRELTQADVEKLWVKDRKALVQCGVTKQALVNWLKKNGKI
jgi:hypothetical protein